MADNTSKEKIVLDFQTNADKASKDVQGLNVSIEQTTESVEDNTKAIGQQDQAYKSFKTQLREATAELQKAVAIYGETSEQAIKAAKGVAELKDTMQAAGDLAETFNPDQKFKALGAATQIAATGVQGVTAGMALFGDQTQDTEKLLLKVQSAMAFSDAISGLSDLGDQWSLLKATISTSSIATKANSAATGAAAIVQNLFTGSVNTSTVGFKGLKLAIAGTGIGLLVVGLVALIQNFDKVKKVVLNFVPGLAAVGDQIMEIVTAITDFVGVTSEADRAIDKMKANADKSLALNKKFLEEHGSQLDEYTKAKIAAVDEYHTLLKEDGANQVALKKELDRKLADQDKARQDEIDKKREEAHQKEVEAAKKRQDAIDKAAKEAKDKQDAIDKANLERIRRQAERARDEYEAAEKIIADAKKANEESLKTDKEKELDQENKDYEDKLKRVQKAGLDTEQLEIQHLNNINDINLKHADKAKEIDDNIFNNKKTQHEALNALGSAGINAAKDLFGRSKAVQKGIILADSGVALGKLAINTVEQVSEDNTASPLTFGLPWSAVHIATGALGAASIISNTTKALAAVGGGGAPSAPSLPSASGTNAKPQTGFQASSENQIATSINGANKAPQIIKAFVVGKDVTDQQTLDSNLVSENSFGGKTGG